jgi:hypothetical protein
MKKIDAELRKIKPKFDQTADSKKVPRPAKVNLEAKPREVSKPKEGTVKPKEVSKPRPVTAKMLKGEELV